MAGLLTSEPRRLVQLLRCIIPCLMPDLRAREPQVLSDGYDDCRQHAEPVRHMANIAQGASGGAGMLLAALRGAGGSQVKVACFDKDGSAQRCALIILLQFASCRRRIAGGKGY